MFLEELNELFRENWSKFLTAGYLVFLKQFPAAGYLDTSFKKSAVVFWPGSEVKIEGQYPTHYLPYDRSLSFEKRIDYLCTMLEQDDLPSFLAA